MSKAKFLALGKVCNAIFWQTTGCKEKAFDRHGFCAEGIFISASAEAHGGKTSAQVNLR